MPCAFYGIWKGCRKLNVLNQFTRTELLLGRTAMERLARSRVIIFGIGGVGGYVVEALVRSGVGAIDFVDSDKISLTNLNRQIIATRKTIGRYKTDVMLERVKEINPDCQARAYKCFYLPETKDQFIFENYDYIVDAIDTVSGKIQLVLQAKEAKVPIISSMGAGNKLDPTGFEITDIYNTSVCPLAKVMRRELKKRGVEKLLVVYSKEEPRKPIGEERVPGSNAFVPPVVGLIIASEIIKELTKEERIYSNKKGEKINE